MDSKRRVTYATLVLLISTSYQCTARWINDTDMTDITREVKSALNVARNTSRAPVIDRGKQLTHKLQESALLKVLIHAGDNHTTVQVRIPHTKYNKTFFAGRNKVVEIDLTRQMLSSLNDSSGKTSTADSKTRERITMMQIQHIQSQQIQQYKSATIVLAVACAVMFLVQLLLILRHRRNGLPKKVDEGPSEVPTKPSEGEYQSIRGLPRQQTGNSYGYETVKPRLPPTRPSITNLLKPKEAGEYENLNVKISSIPNTSARESNPYMPMDEALAGSGLTGSAVLLSGEDEEIYLTMKRLIKTPMAREAETHDLSCI